MDAPTLALIIGAIAIQWMGSGSLLALVRALFGPYTPNYQQPPAQQ